MRLGLLILLSDSERFLYVRKQNGWVFYEFAVLQELLTRSEKQKSKRHSYKKDSEAINERQPIECRADIKRR